MRACKENPFRGAPVILIRADATRVSEHMCLCVGDLAHPNALARLPLPMLLALVTLLACAHMARCCDSGDSNASHWHVLGRMASGVRLEQESLPNDSPR